MTIENNPFEIMGLERLVEDQSADYIGKDALMRIRAEGVSRKLVGVVLDGDEQIPGCPDVAPIYRDGEEIGQITVLVWSPRMQRNIGYVWVPIELAAPGNALEVTTLDGTAPGKTAAVPFFDPRKSVPQAGTLPPDRPWPGGGESARASLLFALGQLPLGVGRGPRVPRPKLFHGKRDPL